MCDNAHFPLKSGAGNTRDVLGDGGDYYRTKWKLSFGYYDYRNISKAWIEGLFRSEMLLFSAVMVLVGV